MINSPTQNPNDRKIDIAIAKYQLANDRNIMESEAQWNRSNSFLVFNTILITAITLGYQKDVDLPWCLIIFLPIAGLMSCLLWLSMNSRSFKWIKHWINCTREIEKKYLKDNPESNIKELNPVVYGLYVKEKDKPFLNSEDSTTVLIVVLLLIHLLFILSALPLHNLMSVFCTISSSFL